ncbi:MAG: hemerythrin domain-containing protein [Flavobacterium sp.]
MNSNKPLKRVPELQPLSHDHHHGLQLCWKIRTGLAKNIEPKRIKKYADWFFETHLKLHFELEEKYIFTILNNEDKLIKQALIEHRLLEKLFEQTSNLTENLRQIEKILETHIRFEERILFGEIQKKATTEQLNKINKIHSGEVFIENNDDVFWR